VQEVGKEYMQKITALLIQGSSKDSTERYEAIEKYFSGCKPAKAKEVLEKWKIEVSKFKVPKK
jgi:glutamate synthase domain-containing protein 3